MKVKSESEVTQSRPTLHDSMDCSPPGSSVHGILQARVLEWGAFAFSTSPPTPPPIMSSSKEESPSVFCCSDQYPGQRWAASQIAVFPGASYLTSFWSWVSVDHGSHFTGLLWQFHERACGKACRPWHLGRAEQIDPVALVAGVAVRGDGTWWLNCPGSSVASTTY